MAVFTFSRPAVAAWFPLNVIRIHLITHNPFTRMSSNLFTSTKTRLRVVGFAEGLSYLLLLFIAVPLKRMGGHPEAVQILGPIHGLLFVLYVLIVIQAGTEYRWTLGKTGLALLASILPGGTFWADYKIFRHLPTTEPS